MLSRRHVLALTAAGLASPAWGEADPVAAALADPARPAADRAADGRRRAAETLALSGVRPGWRVIELFPGGGYFSRVLSRVVGRDGRVYLLPWQEPQSGQTRKLAADPAYGNFSYFGGSPIGFAPERPVDLVFTVQNYHDIATPQRGQINQLVRRWLRPGGVYLIVDHAAVDGSGYAGLPLHRIDEVLVKKEVEAAGFRLDGQSQALRNPADDRKLNVFDPAIRGRTDQFMLRFVKPAS